MSDTMDDIEKGGAIARVLVEALGAALPGWVMDDYSGLALTIVRAIGDERQAVVDRDFDTLVALSTKYNDLRAVVEYADTRTEAAAEKDGMVEAVTLSATDWNRIIAVARGHKSEAAQKVINSVVLGAEPDGRAVLAALPATPGQGDGLRADGLLRALGRGSAQCSGAPDHRGVCPCHCHTVGRLATPAPDREPPTDLPSEYGRLLAERDRLIEQGVDPADLLMPDPPEKP